MDERGGVGTSVLDAPDERVGQALEQIADGRRRQGYSQLVTAAALALLVIGVVVVRSEAQRTQDTVVTLQADNTQQDTALGNLTQDSLRLREELAKRGVDPNTVAPPPETRLADPGKTGPTGPPGRAIVLTLISGGRLQVYYSDGTKDDVGTVVGDAGRSVTGAAVTAGNLMLSYSDGSQANVGPVVGPGGATGATGAKGVGVVDARVVDGVLDLLLADGTSLNAGTVLGPQGPPGKTGAPGAAGPTGAPGAPGAAGVGYSAVTCSSAGVTFTLTFTRSDGSVEAVPCVATSPTASPTATATATVTATVTAQPKAPGATTGP